MAFPDRARCWIAELVADVASGQKGQPDPAGAWAAVRDWPPCDGVLIRAHLIPKQRIAREFPRGAQRYPYSPPVRITYPGEPIPESTEVVVRARPVARGERRPAVGYRSVDEIVWDPRCWVPMCGGPMGNGGHHGMLDAGGVRRIKIERAWLPPAVEEFAVEYGLEWSLEADYGPRET